MIFIGIDPGIQGGIAYFNSLTNEYNAIQMPTTRKQVSDYLKELKKGGECFAAIEKCSAMPGQGVSSMYKFGKGCGEILGICTALDFIIIEPTPQIWKKIILEGTDKSKEAAIRVSENLYPKINLIPNRCRKPQDGMADAICLMHYAKIKNNIGI